MKILPEEEDELREQELGEMEQLLLRLAEDFLSVGQLLGSGENLHCSFSAAITTSSVEMSFSILEGVETLLEEFEGRGEMNGSGGISEREEREEILLYAGVALDEGREILERGRSEGVEELEREKEGGEESRKRLRRIGR